jgi:Tfp pilus assembly protein PilN
MRAVNLLPKDDGRSSGAGATQSVPLLVGASGAIFVVSLLAAGFMFESGKAKKAQADLRAAQATLAALPAPPPAQSASEEQLATQQTARLAALQTALSRRVAWDRIFREISLILPDDVWLTEMKDKSPAPGSSLDPARVASPAAAAEGLSITGRTYSHDSVARLLSRLQLIPELTNVQLQSSDILDTHVVEFTILADIRMPAGSS